MTAKTAPARRVTTAVDPTYAELLTRVRQLFHTDVETRFEMAVIFSKMLKLKTADEIAEDTDMAPGGVVRIARVAEFWGNVRIAPDGKKRAPWHVYDRVATDVMIDDKRKQLIKRAAAGSSLSTVRQMIRDARTVSVRQVNEVVNGKRAARTTETRGGAAKRTGTPVSKRAAATADVDGVHYVQRSLDLLTEADNMLDKLESLSEGDAALVRRKIDVLVRHVLRLTQVD